MATTSTASPGTSSATPETEPRPAVPPKLAWLAAEILDVIVEAPRVGSLVLDVPGWTTYWPGQQVDVRLTAEDGYQAQRSYSLAPLMSMLRHRAAAGSTVPALLLYSSRSTEDIIFRDERDRLAAVGDGLRVVHTLTRRQPAGWTAPARRTDLAMLSKLGIPPSERPWIYVCGPTAMVEQATKALISLGHASARIRAERFEATGDEDGTN